MTAIPVDSPPIEWERALWKRTAHPDNYEPDTFLSSLSRNGEY